ncbi:MAG TPA: SDR family NAD(P)-dependent oxidoreductase, partial [Oscillatoriaceae cyanobacterium]
MKRLIDKVVVVTGASRGIGRAIAEAFAREGARVVLAARNLDPLRDVERQIVARRGRAHAVACDVTIEDDVARLAQETLKRYDGLDIWVNNAGVSLAK